jgi:superfamily II DNA or RNA helicase
MPDLSPADKVKLFAEVFRGRDDVHARRWEKEQKGGYAPVRGGLDAQLIEQHLRGAETLGIYPLLPDNTTWLLAIDFDGRSAPREAQQAWRALETCEVPAYLERSRSGQGAHVWVFFDRPLAARRARELGQLLKRKAGLKWSTFDRLFPSQDEHLAATGIGNLIALPLQRQARANGNAIFLDPRTMLPLPDQWALLSNIRRLSPDDLDRVLSEPLDDGRMAPVPDPEPAVYDGFTVVLKEHLEVVDPIPEPVLELLKRRSTLTNPEWHKRKRRDLYLGDTPRFLRCGARVGDRWLIVRGAWPELRQLLEGMPFALDDQRSAPVTEPWSCSLELRSDQTDLVERAMQLDEVVIEAPTGSGKTVVAIELMARRQLRCLVLVPNRLLAEQWIARIQSHLGIPKKQIGKVGPSGIRVGELVTVATLQSLARRDLSEHVESWGHVVVDECHHIPARTFAAVLKQLRARVLLGLTATPRRTDSLCPWINLYLGQTVQAASGKELAEKSVIVHPRVEVVTTSVRVEEQQDFQSIKSALLRDPERNRLIQRDVARLVALGHLTLVLTDRKEHCDVLSELFPAAILYGNPGKKARQAVLEQFESGQTPVLIATTHILGEGWDCPPLSALVLASPVGASSRLEQMLGRVTRPKAGKAEPLVVDYLDAHVPLLKSMFEKRVKLYRKILGDPRLPEAYRRVQKRVSRATLGPPPPPPVRRRKEPVGQLDLFG